MYIRSEVQIQPHLCYLQSVQSVSFEATLQYESPVYNDYTFGQREESHNYDYHDHLEPLFPETSATCNDPVSMMTYFGVYYFLWGRLSVGSSRPPVNGKRGPAWWGPQVAIREPFPHPGGPELEGRIAYCLQWGVPLLEADWEEASRLGKASACMQAIIK